MTNNEILNANLLDIVFDNRNKEYGAYALRRDYNHRLLMALGAGMSVILFFLLVNVLNKDEKILKDEPSKIGEKVTLIKIPNKAEQKKEKPKEQPKPKPIRQKIDPIAQVEFKTIKIVPDDKADKAITTQAELKGRQISLKTTFGKETDTISIAVKPVTVPGTGDKPIIPEPVFLPSYSDPQYPGGQQALSRFFSDNLVTPAELGTGEKKMTKIRFKIDKDGYVADFEITQSGGDIFDSEVIRVCKKMRRWKPALQNGVPVTISYILPVTFIGAEQ